MAEVVITATALLCAVMLLRLVLKKRISAGLRYALWLLVLIRLLIPINLFPSRASVMNALPGSEVLQENFPARPVQDVAPAQAPQPEPHVQIQAAQSEQAPQPVPELTAPAPEPASEPISPQAVVSGVWLAGAIAVGAWFLAVNLRFSLRLRRTRRRLALDYPIPVYQADFLPSPCLAGVFRPAIYLNANAAALEDQAALQHILTHELCHKKHGDQLWSILRGLCLALWWFHPLVWAAAILSKRDCELACDEAAVKALGEAQRIPYGMTLVSMVNQKRPGPRELLCASTSMTEGKKEIKERVIFVTNRKKMTKRALTLALALALLAGICTFTGALSTNGPSALPYQVEPDLKLKQDDLNQNVPAIPDFPWNGDAGDYRREVSTLWTAEYGKQFYALPVGHPWKADDVKVVEPVFHPASGAQSGVPYRAGDVHDISGWTCLAIKPAGGLEAVTPLFQGGVPRGTGDLSEYALLEYHLDLERKKDSAGAWYWGVCSYVSPAWNQNPPPDYQDWTDELMETWKEQPHVDVSATVEGTGRESYQAAGERWAEIYTRQLRALPDNGTPLKSDDTQVLSVTLEAQDPAGDAETLFFHIKYAFRPVWGVKTAGPFLSKSRNYGAGGNYGEGEWADYIIVDAAVTLVRDAVKDGKTTWKGFSHAPQYPSNYDDYGMNLAVPFEVPKREADALDELAPVGLSTSYPAGTDETRMQDVVYGQWAAAFAQQFYHLDPSHPLACRKVAVSYLPAFYPTKKTASGLNRVADQVTEQFGFTLWPLNGQQKAAEALGEENAQCWPDDLEGAGMDLTGGVGVSWAVTLARTDAPDGGTAWVCTAAEPCTGFSVRDLPSDTPMALPQRVEPRPGWSISALDPDAVYVPDDGKGDLRNRWAYAYGQEFYALPEGNLWRASDVQIRYAGDTLCLAVKPIGGTAALEPYFPEGCTKGSGDLEGYILLQYRGEFRRELIPAFSGEPVWVADMMVLTRARNPPEVGSEEWDMEAYNRNSFVSGQSCAYFPRAAASGTEEEVAKSFVQKYLDMHLEFSWNEPILSDDVKLLELGTPVSGVQDGKPTLTFRFRYAFRPIWGADVVEACFGSDAVPGTGDLAGYFIRDFSSATLEYRQENDAWYCTGMVPS